MDHLETRYQKLQAVNRTKLQEYEFLEHQNAARCIQAIWRGYRARKLTKQRKKTLQQNPIPILGQSFQPSLNHDLVKSISDKIRLRASARNPQVVNVEEVLGKIVQLMETKKKFTIPSVDLEIDWAEEIEKWQSACTSGKSIQKSESDRAALHHELDEHKNLINQAVNGWWKFPVKDMENEERFQVFLDNLGKEDLDNEPRWY
jgi:chloramphenicol O-acetyltransferase